MTKPVPDHDLPLGHLKTCQLCASTDLELVLDLGHHPPCDSLLRPDQLLDAERTYPLRFVRCLQCGLAQIDYVVAPEVLFHAEYPYRSGITDTLSQHLLTTAETVVRRCSVAEGSLVMDIGSNDGTILQAFKALGAQVLGVEPTEVAKIAIESGVPTEQAFFSEKLAAEIESKHGKAHVITATNMFAHVANLGDLIRGVSHLLVDGGVFVTESHYLRDLVETLQYDSIYHEHLKYYSVKPLTTLMAQHGFTIVDIERIPNYGGSIRVYAVKGKGTEPADSVDRLIVEEERAGLYDAKTYADFRERVIRTKLDFQELLLDLKKAGKGVIGIGCPGRCSTLLNYCSVDRDLMPYIAEQANSLKLGLFLPGKHIPVVDEKRMFEEHPDYAVMLSWHYAMPIMRKLRAKGLRSKFILPLPEVRVAEV